MDGEIHRNINVHRSSEIDEWWLVANTWAPNSKCHRFRVKRTKFFMKDEAEEKQGE